MLEPLLVLQDQALELLLLGLARQLVRAHIARDRRVERDVDRPNLCVSFGARDLAHL